MRGAMQRTSAGAPAAADASPAGAASVAAPAGPPAAWRTRLDGLATPGGMLMVAALVIAAILVTEVERDPDFWWHLQTGQLLLANHLNLLGNDPYTYTVSGHHWTMHEWLFEVLVAVIYNSGGLGAIVAALSLLTWLGIVAILLRARFHTRNRLALGMAVIVGVVAANPIWGPRDQMIDFTFSCVLLLVVERHLCRGGRILWLLPPLFLLWTNLHGGFVIGLTFLGLIAVAEAAGLRLGLPEPVPLRRCGWLALTAVGCLLVAMVNPNGPGILLYAWQTVSSPAQQALIQEWQSPNFHLEAVRPFAVMLVSLAAFLIFNRRLRARDAVLVAVTAALSLESARNIALFVAAATPAYAEQLALLLERLGGGLDARRRQLPPFGFRVGVLAAVSVLLIGGYAALRLVPAVTTTPQALTYAQTYPVCAAQWLRSGPRDLRIFNQYGEGGYLAWSLAGTGDKVFIFGDAALMGDSLLYTYSDVVNVEPGWENTLEGYDTQVVLADTGTAFDQVLRQSPRWMLVYHDPLSDAFVLRSERATLNLPAQPTPTGTCAQLAATGLPATSSQ